MSNGYIVAAEADIADVREIADALGLDLIGAGDISDHAATGAALASAASVGLVLSTAAAQDASFTALVRSLATQLPTALLILVTPEARGAFDLPAAWPTISIDEARARARAHSEQSAPGYAAPEAPSSEHRRSRASACRSASSRR